MLLMAMIACTVVMAVQTVGLILVIALLTIPAYVAESHSRNLKQMMLLACGLSLLLSLAGLLLAYQLNFTVGPVIILLGVLLYAGNRIFTRRSS